MIPEYDILGGSLTAISVLILARSQNPMILRSALKRSRPAEHGEPRTGVVAFSDNFLNLRSLSIFSKIIKFAHISVVVRVLTNVWILSSY